MSRFIIVGGGGSGKDYLKRKLQSRGLKSEVSFTTRPMRDGEQNGITYHFVSDEDFDKMVEAGRFLQHKEFRGWKYGTANEEWLLKDIFIMTPEGIESIPKEDRKDSVVIYLDIVEDIRRRRLEERNDVDSVDRRMMADRKQFEDFEDFDIRITNPNF